MTKKKILLPTYCMNYGGAETWLMHVLRNIDRSQLEFHVLSNKTDPEIFAPELREMGIGYSQCPGFKQYWKLPRFIREVNQEFGPFDIVHSHVDHFNGYILRAAAMAGIPRRIAHSHNDTRMAQKNADFLHRCYYNLGYYLLNRHATEGFACSEYAAIAQFGQRWKSDPRWKILYYGIQFNQCPITQNGSLKLREELGIPQKTYILGHVGSFKFQKNHTFLIDILHEVVMRDPEFHLLMVGDGELQPEIVKKVNLLNLNRHVSFLGLRSDVTTLMSEVMDAFVFPSHFEGLPMVAIEAQSCGLPCFLSDHINHKVQIVPELTETLPINGSAQIWADAILHLKNKPNNMSRESAWIKVKDGPFNIQSGVRNLEHAYLNHKSILKSQNCLETNILKAG